MHYVLVLSLLLFGIACLSLVRKQRMLLDSKDYFCFYCKTVSKGSEVKWHRTDRDSPKVGHCPICDMHMANR